MASERTGQTGDSVDGGNHLSQDDISLGRAFRLVEISPFLCGTSVDSPVEFQRDAYHGRSGNRVPYYWAPHRGKESVR
jgi:hypothetical protein